MSLYENRDAIGNPHHIPPSLRPGLQEHQGPEHQGQWTDRGRRVSFAVPPMQPTSNAGTPHPQQSEPATHHRRHAHSVSVVNNELPFNPGSAPSASTVNNGLHFNLGNAPSISVVNNRLQSNPAGPSGVPPLPHTAHTVPPVAVHPGFPSQQEAPRLPPKRPDFLIIGLFALRLAADLIRCLDDYPERDSDLAWIARFLRPYNRLDALARISEARMEDYVTNYPAIISRFIKQPRYPDVFTALKPGRRTMERPLTDKECMGIVDFADAAGEWGSTIQLPGKEAERIESLAQRRRMANY